MATCATALTGIRRSVGIMGCLAQVALKVLDSCISVVGSMLCVQGQATATINPCWLIGCALCAT
jgi:hypothetical protein